MPHWGYSTGGPRYAPLRLLYGWSMVCPIDVTLRVVHGMPHWGYSTGGPWCAPLRLLYGWSMVCPIEVTLRVVHGMPHWGYSTGGPWYAPLRLLYGWASFIHHQDPNLTIWLCNALPRSHVHFTATDDAGELKENGEPSLYPDTITLRYIHRHLSLLSSDSALSEQLWRQSRNSVNFTDKTSHYSYMNELT